MNRKDVLDKALKCVNGDREQDYGSPENNFRTIAEMWSAYLSAAPCMEEPETGIAGVVREQKTVVLDPFDVAAMLSLLKIARIASGHAKEDNWIDLAGYAACGGELQGRLNDGGK